MATQPEFEAAGLYDPAIDADTGRLELLFWLDEKDFTIAEMVDALHLVGLGAVASDRRLVPGKRLDRETALARSGLTAERFGAITTALGFTSITESITGEPGITEAELGAVTMLDAIAGMFTEAETLGFLRVLGRSFARVGEAGVSLFLTDIESPHLARQGNELELAEKVYNAIGLLDELGAVLDPLLRRHVLQAIQRSRLATIDQVERLRYRYAIGFVDLVGFTPISHDLSPVELGNFIRNFEGQAHDAVTEVGARLVKLIGDEVMFVAPDPEAAYQAAKALMTAFHTPDGEVLPCGGLAYGEVLVRGGDYYGEIVNLASRLVDEAVPLELLVTDEFAAAAKTTFEPAGRRMLKGFAEPVVVQSAPFSR
ncbi:MAG: adenylate/guanylate cyclase domain-containing protein [Acidimicrobiales bacterium]|nr:adenylate/guanylate cyclase domain-containing protein [Acidimicrobiales bacterium]